MIMCTHVSFPYILWQLKICGRCNRRIFFYWSAAQTPCVERQCFNWMVSIMHLKFSNIHQVLICMCTEGTFIWSLFSAFIYPCPVTAIAQTCISGTSLWIYLSRATWNSQQIHVLLDLPLFQKFALIIL